MQHFRIPKLCGPALLLGIATMVMTGTTGCDKAEELAAEAKSSIEEQMGSEPETPVASDNGTPTPVPNNPPPEKPKPKPEDLFADFQKLTPEKVSDSELALVASLPESAAMVTEVTTTSEEFGAEGIRILAQLENLETVSIGNATLRPADLKGLGNANSLKNISISASLADDSVVQSIANLPNLQGLDISSTKITPASAAHLVLMAGLTDLNLRHTQADDTLVSAIANLPIRKLDIAQTRITNAAIPAVLGIKTLEELDVSFNAIQGGAFKGLGSTGIKKLNVGETQFGIDGFVNLRGMRELVELNVYNAGLVQHRKADVFTGLKKLKVLNAGGNAIADAGVHEFFKGHSSLVHLKLDNNKGITDNGLAALVGVKTLMLLEVNGTGCTAQGAAALKQRLPKCVIHGAAGQF